MRRNPSRIVDITDAVCAADKVVQTALCTVRKPLLAFSGGKESVVLAHICARHGIDVAVRDNALTFHRVEKQVMSSVVGCLNMRLTNVDRFGRDWVFRPGNRKFLFPETGMQGRFFQIAQQATVKRYAARGRYDAVFLGRRRQENCVPAQMYRTSDGVLQVMPLAFWTVEEVWSYIHKYRLAVPDIYDTKVGLEDGCTPWNLISPEKIQVHPFRFIHDWDADTWNELVRMQPAVQEYL
jgi:3'-phosphoadenosine 5'-phosphosulfate sulfotransferase (PAPS reductase)/FAD synthetase